jgi:SSS family solute:Na+ symporter
MSAQVAALLAIVAVVALGAMVGLIAAGRRPMDLEQWTVGGRGFGVALTFLLMAGETYTTFAFLGASGWAYSRGGPTLYILAYTTLAYVVSFFILPQIWVLGRKHGMQTQSDFFRKRYENPYLTGLVCVVGIFSIIPYLQLKGLVGVAAHASWPTIRDDRHLCWHAFLQLEI